MNTNQTGLTANEITTSRERASCAKLLEWYTGQIGAKFGAVGAIFLQLYNDREKPWRFQYESYDDYCEKVWHMTPRRALQLRTGEAVKALMLTDAPDMAPVVQSLKEGQLRELATVPREKRAEVLKVAIETERKPTGRALKQAKARVIEGEIVTPVAGKSEYTARQIEEASSQTGCAGFCPVCKQKLP